MVELLINNNIINNINNDLLFNYLPCDIAGGGGALCCGAAGGGALRAGGGADLLPPLYI